MRVIHMKGVRYMKGVIYRRGVLYKRGVSNRKTTVRVIYRGRRGGLP